jgi:YkoY family integral membrane protein
MNDLIQQISVLWQDIISHPGASLAIIGNLIIIESLLSVDNAAVLATMVMDLPEKQRDKALKYGIWGAYFFRGLAMIFAAVLIQIWWLKPLGGLYLLLLVYKQFNKEDDEQDPWFIRYFINPWLNPISKLFSFIFKPISVWLDNKRKLLGLFWSTVVLVEIMDMAFSIDNIFAAVAFTPNIILVCIGVFIGILAMRFIAQWFVKLMEKYTFLETAAFVVIAILGIKLTLSLYEHYYPESGFSEFLSSHTADIGISVLTVSIFFIPIMTSVLFNYPKKHTTEE